MTVLQHNIETSEEQKMQWIEVSVPAVSGEIDELCEQLAALGAGGMVGEDEQDFQNFLETNHQYWDDGDEAL